LLAVAAAGEDQLLQIIPAAAEAALAVTSLALCTLTQTPQSRSVAADQPIVAERHLA